MHRSLQPAQVETVKCYCRAEASPNVAGSKGLATGCLQPDIKQSIRLGRRSVRKGEKNCLPPDLIPGLPNDLAIACLIRVPRLYHRKLRLVCKKWHILLTGNYFFCQRIRHGMSEEWIYVIKRDRDGHISWHAFDPKYQLWQPLPPVPREYSEALGFGCAALNGHLLFLFGGKDPLKGSMKKAVYYNPRTNRWSYAPDMLRRRHFFGSCVIGNCLYVAGGECEGIQRSLRSAEVFDPLKKKWSFIHDMGTLMVPFIGVVYEGKWFLKGLGANRQVMSEMYAPATNHWAAVYNGMTDGWRNPSTSLNGRLYALDCKDGCKLRVYDAASDRWHESLDSKHHLGSSHALEAAALLPLGGRLCIVRNNMSITVVDTADGRGHAWETIAGRSHFKSFIGNLWSSISGKIRQKSHIVHCQVLEA